MNKSITSKIKSPTIRLERRASWWRIGGGRLTPVARAELAKINQILAVGGNGKH